MTELLREVALKYRKHNRLYAVLMELTWRCVCECAHCYLDGEKSDELSSAEIADLLDQMKDEGVVDLGFTGGEIFLREDLPLILSEARGRGFVSFLLTTGILVDEAAADMILREGVHHVEMSLMGGSPETHDGIMRHGGAFAKTMHAVRLLRERNIPVVLKNSVLRQNAGELERMAELAAGSGALFVASASILPTVGGDKKPQDLMVDHETLSGLNPEWTRGAPMPDEDSSRGALLDCNAGRTNCGVSPAGDVYPCLVWRRPVGNLRKAALKDIWHVHTDPYLDSIRRAEPRHSEICFGCPEKSGCRRCPGMAFSESGNFLAPAPSACLLAGKEKGPVRQPVP